MLPLRASSPGVSGVSVMVHLSFEFRVHPGALAV
ncbi:hypothetical protein ARTHRO9AX_220467 [Arthrobacter sp. 9AX]|nr:hypothetical protein ARTHRO9AX_220467 [Arthrobacter sp. 9AX]